MLFGTTKLVLYLSHNKIVVADCRSKPTNYWEITYANPTELVKVLDKIIHKFESNSYKIILDSSVSYTICLPKTVEDLPSRDQVRLDLGKEVPENFDDAQFDWKLLGDNQIEAIVITTPVYASLQKIRSKYSQLRLSTQSVESLLEEMGTPQANEAPTPELFSYAAELGSPRGKDATILNINIKPEVTSLTTAPTTTTTSNNPSLPRSHSEQTLVIIFLIVFILGCIGVGIRYYYQAANPAISPAPTPSLSLTPTPTPLPKQASDFQIIVQNGTKKSGLAAETQSSLQAKGFINTETGNALEPAATTTITINEALPDHIQQLLLDALAPRTPEITVTPNQTDHDIVITLGTK